MIFYVFEYGGTAMAMLHIIHKMDVLCGRSRPNYVNLIYIP